MVGWCATTSTSSPTSCFARNQHCTALHCRATTTQQTRRSCHRSQPPSTSPERLCEYHVAKQQLRLRLRLFVIFIHLINYSPGSCTSNYAPKNDDKGNNNSPPKRLLISPGPASCSTGVRDGNATRGNEKGTCDARWSL